MLSVWLLCLLIVGYLIYAMASTLLEENVELTIGNTAFGFFVFLVLPVLLFYFFRHVFRAGKRWRTWRNCLFEHFSMPAFLGSDLVGKLMLPDQLADGEIISYSLGCFRQRRYQRERVGNKGISLWQSDTLKKRVASSMTSIPIQIDLPKSRPESNWSGSYGHIKWLLSIKTANDGFEDIDYEVPVFFNPYDV